MIAMRNTENIGDVTTTPDYWDCVCFDRYIHDKNEVQVCPRCGAKAEDMPDSRLNEVTGSIANNNISSYPSESKWVDKWCDQDFLYR